MKNLLRKSLANVLAGVLDFRSDPHPWQDDGTVLVIAPHADDETLGCGGLIAQRASHRLRTCVAFITDSAGTSTRRSEREEQARVRRGEALEALRVLGVPSAEVSFLGAPDGQLDRLDAETKGRLFDQMRSLIEALNPSAIYVPFRGSHSTEHEAAHGLCLELLDACEWEGRFWEYPVWAWWNPPRFARCCRSKPAPTVLELGPLLALKRKALLAHASQNVAGGALPGVLAELCLRRREFFFPITRGRGLQMASTAPHCVDQSQSNSQPFKK